VTAEYTFDLLFEFMAITDALFKLMKFAVLVDYKHISIFSTKHIFLCVEVMDMAIIQLFEVMIAYICIIVT
jgi:hypothetical protein